MYQKEIIYMGLHKDGSRVGSAGFVKAEKRDKTGSLTVIVKNIPRSIEGRFPVRYSLGAARDGQAAESGEADATGRPGQMDRMEWKEEDGITLHDGGGIWEKKGLEASERIYVQILLPNGYLVEGKSKAALRQTPPKDGMAEPVASRQPVPVQGDASVVSREPVPAQWDAHAVSREAVSVQGDAFTAPREAVSVQGDAFTAPREAVSVQGDAFAASREAVSVQGDVFTAPREAVSVQEDISAAESAVSAPQPVVPRRPPLMADALAIEGLKEDKWEQILDTYDKIHPYGDDRVYVKIAPKDFIIMSGSCQHLVNNSFLLHGFYNYRYVILGKRENSLRELSPGGHSVSSPEGEYFLGVPGVFYEREKMVALMFGFEAFECEGGDPKPGDFGYYLRKVEL